MASRPRPALAALAHAMAVASLTCVACNDDAANESAGSGGGGGVAGASGAAGSPAVGGTGGLSPGCTKIPPFDCVPSWCGGDVLLAPTCSYGQWTCPNGRVPRSECPDDACFHPPVFTCCDAQGDGVKPTCPNQAAEVCPSDRFMDSSGNGCPPAGEFRCGTELTCKLGQEYCLRIQDGATTCEPLPAECSSQLGCSCLASVFCGSCHDAGIGALAMNC